MLEHPDAGFLIRTMRAKPNSTPVEQESIAPDLIDRETIAQMHDEPMDGRENQTRYLAIARIIEAGTTVVLYANSDGTHGFDRQFPLPLEWTGIPRSVCMPEDASADRLPDTTQAVVTEVLEEHAGIEVDEDRSVDWRVRATGGDR